MKLRIIDIIRVENDDLPQLIQWPIEYKSALQKNLPLFMHYVGNQSLFASFDRCQSSL